MISRYIYLLAYFGGWARIGRERENLAIACGGRSGDLKGANGIG
jgi:hypothetical protein